MPQVGRLRHAILGTALACVGWVASLAAEELASERAVHLVGMLGSGSFSDREHAMSQLARLGLDAKPALLAGQKSPDAEVRLRCQKLLKVVLEQDFQKRLAAFAADKEGQFDYDLPGWKRFGALLGTTSEARTLFVEMQRAEPALMAATESKPGRAAEQLSSRCQEMQRALTGQDFTERVAPSNSSLAAAFFLAGDAKVALDDVSLTWLANFVAYRPPFQSALRSGPRSEMYRKLVGAWLDRLEGSDASFQAIQLAMQFDLKEGLRPALSAIGRPMARPVLLLYGVLLVGKYGDKSHVPDLEPLLENSNACVILAFNGEKQTVQVRDVALAVLVHLTDQNHKEYGFTRIEADPMYLFNPNTLGFLEEDKREGIEKWKAWSKAQKTETTP